MLSVQAMSSISDYTIEDSILPDSIKYVDHFRMFDLVAKKHLDAVEIDAVLVYLIDRVDASAIPFLASQFDVLGYKGMRLASTEQQQREVLKRAIELHRYKGTVWAVKQALINIGYPNAELIEHADMTVENGWATFRINLDPGSNAINVTQISELVKMVTEYKNVRSHLLDISYSIALDDDAVSLTDDSYEGVGDNDSDAVTVGGNFLYDGNSKYDGSKNYSNDTDILEIEIIDV